MSVAKWIEWIHIALVTGPIAVVLAFPCLLFRYRFKGRPFGSRKAARLSVVILLVTAVLVSAVAVLARSQVPAYSVDFLVPALIFAPSSGDLQAVETPAWLHYVSFGLLALVDMLEARMDDDRAAWRDKCLADVDTDDPVELREAAKRLYRFLSGRQRLAGAVKSHYDCIDKALKDAARYRIRGNSNAESKQMFAAAEALDQMLNLAYNRGILSALPIKSPKVA